MLPASAVSGVLPLPPTLPPALRLPQGIHPEAALGLEIGDAHMIRNAGGRASEDALRSLVISQQLLGTKEILLLHHTDCLRSATLISTASSRQAR